MKQLLAATALALSLAACSTEPAAPPAGNTQAEAEAIPATDADPVATPTPDPSPGRGMR